MKRLLILLAAALLLLCGAAGADAEGNRLQFDRSVTTVFEGETLQTVLIREGAPAAGEAAYSSGNEKVAVVDQNGLVTGISRGQATISVAVKTDRQTFRAQVNITVARKVTSLEVAEDRLPLHAAGDPALAGLLKDRPDPEENGLPVLTVSAGRGYAIPVSALPKDANNRKVTMKAEDPAILRVNGNSVTGLQAGETLLTLSSEQNPEVQVRYRVAVIRPVSRITLTAPEKSVGVGETMALETGITPADASLPGVTWSSADERIATVDEKGVVTGVKRGNARIVATATDGSNVRANISVSVTQKAEAITLDKPEVTVDAGKSIQLRATVLPQDTNDKGVLWTSSDESIAKVNAQGRVTGVALGDCEILCTSKVSGSVQARAVVHVQQPVTKITFGDAPVIYAGETGKLTWTVEPANASNPAVTFTAGNRKVLQVDADGTVTGLKLGESYVDAMSTDGSNRRARIKVKVLQHVEGVHMKRRNAYISVGETSTTGAVLEPENASNKNMSWSSADPYVASVTPIAKQGNRVKITGIAQGETTVTGVTGDGGFPASITVKVGDWDHALQLDEAHVEGADAVLTVRNVSSLYITSVTAEVSVYDVDGEPVAANSKDDSNTFKMVYKGTLAPGDTTQRKRWQPVNFKLPDSMTVSQYVVKVTQYQIENDWIKTIRRKYQPTKKCPVHI